MLACGTAVMNWRQGQNHAHVFFWGTYKWLTHIHDCVSDHHDVFEHQQSTLVVCILCTELSTHKINFMKFWWTTCLTTCLIKFDHMSDHILNCCPQLQQRVSVLWTAWSYFTGVKWCKLLLCWPPNCAHCITLQCKMLYESSLQFNT